MSKEQNPSSIGCSHCHQQFTLSSSAPIRFCPLCGQALKFEDSDHPQIDGSSTNELLSNRYQILENIGKGGMGEVFLAFDTLCGRRIALKKIRSDLLEHPHIRRRFLKEAHITCQLTHPAIIPIYAIQSVQLSAYYTMPFVEGETLKQIIRKTNQQEKKGEKLDHIGGSIPALMRVFITICQAVAYAHAKGVLHRDLKPENIIVGKYGEVLILDWGLAKYIHSPTSEDEEEESLHPALPLPQNAEITRVGKVVGTVAYMAPERGLGQPASVQTDIYALGVILYQLLTLKSPFKRGSLEEFRKKMNQEKYQDPVLAAPYRDVPRMLTRVTETCLNFDPQNRYHSVSELIHELENYLEGRSEWFPIADLDIKCKTDWEFQEHVLFAEHIAITRVTEEDEWVNLMISRQSFTGNTRIETSICVSDQGHGIGILLSIPEASERNYINEGYCLWLGSDHNRSTKLLRSNVEVMHAPDIFLKRHKWARLRIEKIDKSIHLYLDDVLQFSYIALLPLIGTHIGILSRDADFEIEPLKISVGSLNLTVNCLAVPDAFLAHRDFPQALSEYRRIAYSFPDRVEGREALFRAGLTFIEQSKGINDKTSLLDQALQEFEKLHATPGGPLEYLGKALVYQTLNEVEEEIKCFELAYRRYPKHPLLPVLQEQILSRMHEVSRQQRMTTYRFIFLTIRHFSPSAIDTHTRRLFSSLQKHWEPLPFIEDQPLKSPTPPLCRFAIPLAFWLAKPYVLGEIIDDLLKSEFPSTIEICNALASLVELGAWKYAKEKLEQIKSQLTKFSENHWKNLDEMCSIPLQSLEKTFQSLFSSPLNTFDFSKKRTLLYAIDQAIDQRQTKFVHQALRALEQCELTFDARLRFDVRWIWALLLEKNWHQAGEVMYAYPVELLNKGTTPLHFLYGCWLQGTEGREMAMIHFMGLLNVTYPRSWTLASHELMGELLQHGWLNKAFLWEKRQLYRQLSLYYHCAGEEQQSNSFLQLYQQQFIYEKIE
jgi:eukaryotic-like serine/threonine-protein kinase